MPEKSTSNVIAKQARKSYPKLWEEEEDFSSNLSNNTNKPSKQMPHAISHGTEESFHWARSVPKSSLPSSGLRFATTTSNETFSVRFQIVLLRSLVVAEQFALSTLFLAANRCVICQNSEDLDDESCVPCRNEFHLSASTRAFALSLLVLFPFTILARRRNVRGVNTQKKLDRIHSRSVDALLIAGILRFLSSLLRTLTASYSSDTVAALAIAGMILHVLSADYDYANGYSDKVEQQIIKGSRSHEYAEKKRPLFLGGTVSINCVFFSAALLASRLPSDTVSYVIFMWTVVLFSYYPEARFLIAHHEFGRIGEIKNALRVVVESYYIVRFNYFKIGNLTSSTLGISEFHHDGWHIDKFIFPTEPRAGKNFLFICSILYINDRTRLEIIVAEIQRENIRSMGYSACGERGLNVLKSRRINPSIHKDFKRVQKDVTFRHACLVFKIIAI